MSKLGRRLDAAKSTARSDAKANSRQPLHSGCILCDIYLPVVDVDGVLNHEARHDGRSVTVPGTVRIFV